MAYNGFNENVVILTGRAVKDAETKKVGTSDLATFRIAHNERIKQSGEGKPKEKTCFIDCETWGKRAEFAGKYVRRGKMVRVMAKLEQDEWKDKDGNDKQKHKLYVFDVQVEWEPREQNNNSDSDSSNSGSDGSKGSNLPF